MKTILKNPLPLTSILIMGLLFFAGCKKESVVSSESQSTIKYKLQTINRTSVVGRIEAGNLVWTSGFGYATQIEFEAKSNTTKVKYESKVPQRIDLFSGVLNLGNITLPPGTYKEIEFEVELNSSGSTPAFELNGNFTSGSTVTPVILRVTSPVEIETEKENVVITDNNGYSALTTLNLSLLSRGVTESMLNNAVRTNGAILISSTSNANIYNIILNNLDECDKVEFEDD